MRNPFDKVAFKKALNGAFFEAITKIGLGNFKRISWFASKRHQAESIRARMSAERQAKIAAHTQTLLDVDKS